eukprot:5145254-Amphidinium_carterae.1
MSRIVTCDKAKPHLVMEPRMAKGTISQVLGAHFSKNVLDITPLLNIWPHDLQNAEGETLPRLCTWVLTAFCYPSLAERVPQRGSGPQHEDSGVHPNAPVSSRTTAKALWSKV